MSFYKEHYDAIIIGGSLAGMAAALQLKSDGISDILILERGHLPGGMAAGFMQNGFDMEVALPNTMFVGSKKEPSKIGRFFEDMGIKVDWQPLPECYRVVLPDFDINVTLRAGYERVARDLNAAIPGTYDGVIGLFHLCRQIYDSVQALSRSWSGTMKLMLKHPAFLKTSGYSAAEVIATFHLPQKAIDVLNTYWVYMGVSLNTLPFTEYALWMAEFFAENRVCGTSSFELAAKMQKKVTERGIQFEFCQTVEKIFVKNGKVTGVRTSRGDDIHCDYVVSTLYPDKVYTQMVTPPTEVGKDALQLVNSHEMAACPVSVVVMIEGTPEENSIQNYRTFFSEFSEDNDLEENVAELLAEDAEISAGHATAHDTAGKSGRGCPTQYNCISAICQNYACPETVPEGYTQLCITALAPAEAFQAATEENYQDLKRQLADGLLDAYVYISGVDFRSWIAEMKIATPVTFSRHTNAWLGSVYGYLPAMEHHIAARMQMREQEQFADGLAFTDIYGASGSILDVQIPAGLMAARSVLENKKRKEDAAATAQAQGNTAVESPTNSLPKSPVQESAEDNSAQRESALQKQNEITADSRQETDTADSRQGKDTVNSDSNKEVKQNGK